MKLYPMIGVSQTRTDTVKRATEIFKTRDMVKPMPERVHPVNPRHMQKPGSRWRGPVDE
ncbi:MAG TPA: hypothetical protein VHN20_01820 [Beijerinckiaceae bacterium]|nr:hypothetical protein [Beijerinckiaceae bacterium]